ncbi:UDP-3-O-(3-hydroxymyristoyl)glucosamine N-acyltransferase [Aminivibrio sp.]|uniref:UDP-3-O-(3-hydroxymyristoyl)glucosamine N-acyltransferase n=1 Tax=Aminivibrio sp. TaxID=1872489 RepID=UPI001A4D88F8|nr:UDP-3-O-(3-hydroxymyristoyl)glucosamine N-acyltransferase [Aminivibrio sp.]MBL3538292.1 UDP-3-O-(3-hydroxymyristoyl)glucosamine N-acyltransferase [Aminivibrio sp.]
MIELVRVIDFLAGRKLLSRVDRQSFDCVDGILSGFSPLSATREGTLSWSRQPISDWSDIRAGAVICPEEQVSNAPGEISILRSPDPRRAFFEVVSRFADSQGKSGIAPSAVIGENVTLGENVFIGPHAVIGESCVIGEDTEIHANVVVYPGVHIGKRCRVFSGAVIGADGFGYFKDENDLYRKIPHIGGVEIGDDVEIGANACIDKGCLDSTVIGENCKIDNFCHIAHNVRLGKNSVLTAGVILCGSVQTGANCWLAPGSVVKDGLSLANNVLVGMNSVVYRSVRKSNVQVVGNPAKIIKVMDEE